MLSAAESRLAKKSMGAGVLRNNREVQGAVRTRSAMGITGDWRVASVKHKMRVWRWLANSQTLEVIR